MSSFKSGHADTGVLSNPIQTSAVILAGVGGAFVDVLFAARPSVASNTVTGEGAVGVHAVTSVFTGVCANTAFISVDVAGAAGVASGTVAVEHAADGVGVTMGALSTRVTDTSIVSMAKQASLPMGAEADEGGHAVDAGGAGAAGGGGTVVDVLGAVGSTPTVHADTHVTARQVTARSPILTSVGLQTTLIHVLFAVLTGPLRRALTVVCVDSIHAGPSVSALMARAVVYVVLTVGAIEPWQTVAGVAEL